jgi:hypothetical protein
LVIIWQFKNILESGVLQTTKTERGEAREKRDGRQHGDRGLVSCFERSGGGTTFASPAPVEKAPFREHSAYPLYSRGTRDFCDLRIESHMLVLSRLVSASLSSPSSCTYMILRDLARRAIFDFCSAVCSSSYRAIRTTSNRPQSGLRCRALL